MKKLYALNLSGLCLLFIVLGMVSCSDGTIGDDFADNNYAAEGAVLNFTNVTSSFFDLSDLNNAGLGFDLEAQGGDVSSAELFVSYNGAAAVSVQSISAIPATVSIPLSDVTSVVGIEVADVAIGDEFLFTTRPVVGGTTYTSSVTLSALATCKSELAGTHSFVSTNLQAITGSCPTDPVTGEVTFTDLGGGKYLCSDLGFGQYGTSCWNDSPATSGDATFVDICNEITSGGLDQYGLTYTWTITGVSGSELSISWVNDYDDSGDVVITKEDGSDWPPIFTN